MTEITKEIAEQLNYREVIYHKILKNRDGTPQQWRVNGKCKTWKRDSSRFELPIKRGLHQYDYVTEYNCDQFVCTQYVIE